MKIMKIMMIMMTMEKKSQNEKSMVQQRSSEVLAQPPLREIHSAHHQTQHHAAHAAAHQQHHEGRLHEGKVCSLANTCREKPVHIYPRNVM